MNPETHAQAANRPDYEKQAKPEETMATTDNNGNIESSTENNENRLYAAPIGPTTYTVLSRGNAGRNAYNVDVAQLTCTCDDYQYNVPGDEDRNVCKHLEKAISKHPHPDAYYSFQGGHVERVDVEQASGAVTGEAARQTEETEKAASGADGKEAAERLRAALDSEPHAFKVQAGDIPHGDRHHGNVSVVWFASEEYIKDDFGKYFTDPEMVGFDPDEAPDGFKNYLEPEDVDAYINEVLQ